MTWRLGRPKLLTRRYLLPLIFLTLVYNYFVSASSIFRDLCETGNKDKIVLIGKACWLDFYKVKHRITVNRKERIKPYIDVKIPMPIINKVKNWRKAERTVFSLDLPLELKVADVPETTPLTSDSFTLLTMGSLKGRIKRLELFENRDRYLQVSGNDLYYMYKDKGGASFVYLVPRDLQAFSSPFYFRCLKRCSFFTTHKRVDLQMGIPKAWTRYPQIVNDFAIGFIESIVVDSNLDIKMEKVNAPN